MTSYNSAGACAIVPTMPNYRRAFVPGGSWFFTVNLLERRQTLLVDHIDDLRDAVGRTRQGNSFIIDAFVVLKRLPAITQLMFAE
jgi:hypothetical protein